MLLLDEAGGSRVLQRLLLLRRLLLLLLVMLLLLWRWQTLLAGIGLIQQRRLSHVKRLHAARAVAV